jgi:predicted nucleic acid-binding protein
MIDVVCDSSVVIGWFGERDPDAEALLMAGIHGRCRLVVLDLTLYEVGNVLMRRYHQPAEATAMILKGVATAADVVRPDWIVLLDAARIAAGDKLTFYDAAHAAQALDLGAALATEDSAIINARLGLRAGVVLEMLGA